jgi:hypothetical protein
MIVRMFGWLIMICAVPLAHAFKFIGSEYFLLDPALASTSWGTIFLTGFTMIFWRD